MNTYRFDAVRMDGSHVRGSLTASSGAEAADLLNRRGLLPIAVTLSTPRTGRHARVPARVQATVLRALASLVSAGVPLVTALRSTRAVAAVGLGEVLRRVEDRVREGASLATAFEAEQLFAPVTIGLLRAGEVGAGLGVALEQSAIELEQRTETRARVRSALAYPAVLLAVGAISIGTIVLVVVPRFAALLGDIQATLPASTRLLLAFSLMVRRHGVPLLGALGGVTIAAAVWVAARRERWHDLLLDLPVIGPIRHAMASVRGARALAALLERGSPALVALTGARTAAGDEAIARRLIASGERVSQGASLSQALTADAAFTPPILQLAAIGDGVGRLPELLRRAADIEERLAEQRLRTLVALLEPLLVVLFAAVVALVATALLQAVYAVRPGAL